MASPELSRNFKELNNVKRNLKRQAERIVKIHRKTIIDYIRERQLFDKGIDGQGNRLIPYTPFTIALKKLKGEVYNRTTLLDQGDFYDGMFVIVRNDLMIVSSVDPKKDDLVKKYGEDIFTFTIDHGKEINDAIIEPNLVLWALSQLNV